MADGTLGPIAGLQDSHRRALAGKLGITSLRALADADQRAIYTALANLRPRPSLARIAEWQADARRSLADADVDRSDWHTAASFAVVFAQRLAGSVWEYRLEAEQTEVEPAAESPQWPDWDCGPLCDWMLGRVPPPAQAAPAARTELRVETATIIDAMRERELIRAGTVVAAPAEDLQAPARLRFTVTGGRSGQRPRAAVWFRRPAEPGWSPHEPVLVSPDGRAEFDLSAVPPGTHHIRLLAWASGTTLAAVSLPTLTLRRP